MNHDVRALISVFKDRGMDFYIHCLALVLVVYYMGGRSSEH